MERILIIAPHPDDEVFGCAGLIQHCLQQNKIVNVVVLTDGDAAYPESLIAKDLLASKRRELTFDAAKILRLPTKNIHFLHWEDGKINVNTKKIDELQQIINDLKPDAIFTPHPFEAWNDHIATTEIVQKLFPSEKIYYYCVWLWYSMPTSKIRLLNWKKSLLLRMNCDEHITKKQAIEAYIQPKTAFGQSFSGVLPGLFIKGNQWNKELYFKIK